MDHVRPDDKTATLGLDQGYRPLHIRQVKVEAYDAMQSAWRPTTDELALLNDGACIILTILGASHPPVLLEVHDISRQDERPRP